MYGWAFITLRGEKKKKETWLIRCCAIFSRVSTCYEKGREATQVGQWWLNATPLHRLWFIIEGKAPCHTSRHLRSHYHAVPGNMTQTEAAVRGWCIPKRSQIRLVLSCFCWVCTAFPFTLANLGKSLLEEQWSPAFPKNVKNAQKCST